MPLHFLYTLTLLGQSGFRGSRLLFSLYALELGASAFTVGVLLAVFSLMTAALGWPAGRWTDRVGCHRPMLVGSLLSMVGFCIPYFFPTLTGLFAAAIVIGAAYSIYHVAQMNVVGVMSTPANRSRNLANLSLMFSVTNFAGPLLAGFSIEHAGHAQACLYFAALALVSMLVHRFGARLLPLGKGAAEKAAGSLSELLHDRRMLKILLVGSVVFAAIDVFQYYVPVYAHGLGLSAATVGMIMACFPAAAFISRICLNWFLKRATVETVLRRSFLLATGAFVLIPFVEGAYALAALSFVYGFGLCVGQPLTLILAYNNASSERTGEVVGIRESVNQITRVLAPVVFGAIGTLAGVLSVFFVGGGLLAWGALMLRSGNLSSPADSPQAGEAAAAEGPPARATSPGSNR